jgi:hypothetical protein
MAAKKEITVAIIIGLILALIVMGGVLRAHTALKEMSQKITTSTSSKESSTKPEKKATDLFLTLDTPDNQVVDQPELTVSGKTLPKTYIAITGEKNEYLIVPSDVGSFSQSVTLVKGANTIRIVIYQEDGTHVEQTLTAVYTTAEL